MPPPKAAGEICTEAKAKELGLYNEKQNTYVAGLEDMRTYSAANPNDYKKTEALCRPSSDGAFAYPLCPIQHGFAFSQVPGDPSRCTVGKCPPGFTPGPNQTCLKPTNSILKDKNGICDEKASDWYSIPYYQLGNGFRKVGNQCYKPCKGATVEVPLVDKDPVDNEAWDVVFSDDAIKTDGSRCVNINDYMGGKYKAPNDLKTVYCPAAVIKRLSVSAEGLQKEMQAAAADSLADVMDQLPSSMRIRMNSVLSSEANVLSAETKKDLENIRPFSRQMKIACDRAVEPEKIAELYTTCKDLKERPGTILQQWRTDNSSLTPNMINTRRTVMEQACHNVFCNNPQNASMAGGQPVCFTVKTASQKDLDIHNGNAKYEADRLEATATGDAPRITSADGKLPESGFVDSYGNKYIKTILTFMTIVLTFIGLVLIFKIITMIFSYNKLKVLEDIRKSASQSGAAGAGLPIQKQGLKEFLISKLPTDKLKASMQALQNNPQASGLTSKIGTLLSGDKGKIASLAASLKK
jgi:hypothetical protein